MIAFITLIAETLAGVSWSPGELRPAGRREIAHARETGAA